MGKEPRRQMVRRRGQNSVSCCLEKDNTTARLQADVVIAESMLALRPDATSNLCWSAFPGLCQVEMGILRRGEVPNPWPNRQIYRARRVLAYQARLADLGRRGLWVRRASSVPIVRVLTAFRAQSQGLVCHRDRDLHRPARQSSGQPVTLQPEQLQLLPSILSSSFSAPFSTSLVLLRFYAPSRGLSDRIVGTCAKRLHPAERFLQKTRIRRGALLHFLRKIRKKYGKKLLSPPNIPEKD